MNPIIKIFVVLMMFVAQHVFAATPHPEYGDNWEFVLPSLTSSDGFDAYDRDDYKTAFAIWLPLAEKGDMDAQLGLGILYYYGMMVPKDLNEAEKWFTLSANQGGSAGSTAEIFLTNIKEDRNRDNEIITESNSGSSTTVETSSSEQCPTWFQVADSSTISEVPDHIYGLNYYELHDLLQERPWDREMWYYINKHKDMYTSEFVDADPNDDLYWSYASAKKALNIVLNVPICD